MTDRRRNRGAHPEDAYLFRPGRLADLRAAVTEMNWLLGRGYPANGAITLVGDHRRLRDRQRNAVLRCSCAPDARRDRERRRVAVIELAGRRLAIDGFNLLTTVEAGLAGGILLRGRDGVLRDLASMHGTWRRVDQTEPALGLAADLLDELAPAACTWWLDRPVSNSGRLRRLLEGVAAERGLDWCVRVEAGVDTKLRRCGEVVASADAGILDAPVAWTHLAGAIQERAVPDAWVVKL